MPKILQRKKARLERGDRARSHAAAGRCVDRSSRRPERGPAQSVDRGLGEHEPPGRASCREKSKEALAAAGQRALVGRAADVDVDDDPAGSRWANQAEPRGPSRMTSRCAAAVSTE